MLYIIETHALIGFLTDDPKLGKRASALLDNPNNKFILPAIVLAESLYLVMKHRTFLTSNELWQSIDELENVKFVDLTKAIIRLTETLPLNLEMHDRMMVATAFYLQEQSENITIITKDNRIRQLNIIPTIWE